MRTVSPSDCVTCSNSNNKQIKDKEGSPSNYQTDSGLKRGRGDPQVHTSPDKKAPKPSDRLQEVFMMTPRILLTIMIGLFASPLAFTQTSFTTVCYFDTKIPKAPNGLRMIMGEVVNSLNQSLHNVLLKTYLFNSTLNHLEALSLLPDCQLTMLTSPSCLIASTVMASTPQSPLLLLTHDPCPELTQPECSLQEDGSCSNYSDAQQVVHVSLAPWLLHWVQATCDVIRTVSWSEVALVMDDTLPSAHHGELISCLTLSNIGSVTLKVQSSNRDVILSLMTSLATTGIRNFLLCVNPLTSSALVSLMKDEDMNLADYHTLVACPGARPDDITTARSLGLRVLVMTYTTPDVRSDVTASLSDPCGFLPSYQQIATDQVLAGLSKLNTTLPFSLSCNTTDTPFLCNQVSETTLSEEQQQKKKKSLEFSEDDVEFSVCGSREWSSVNPLTEVAVWRPARPHQLSVIHPYALTDHFTHFSNLTLTVATLEALPFVKNSSHDSTVSYEGLCIDILDAIAAQLNFTYVITSPQDKKYGAPEEDGTWNGMVGMVKRGEADLAIGPFTITSVRERVVDFTVPYMEDGGGILSRKTDYTPDLMRIFSPFQADIWLATGGMVVVFGLVLFVIMKYDPEHSPPSCMVDQEEGQGLGRVKQRGQLHGDSWNIATSIWTIFGSIMEQGAAKHPRRTSARFVLGCWWVFTILIMSIYTATLAAMLTVTKQPGLIDSIDQVAAATHLTPVTLAGTNWETLFKTAEIGVYKEIGKRMQEGPNVLDVDQALQYVKDGTGVWLYDISQLDYFYRQDCQTLHLAKRVFNANGLGFVLPQQAPFKRAFNRIILKLQEGGFMSMWRKRWWQGGEDCGRSNQGGTSLSQGNQLGTESIGGILLLYGVVVVLAAISMALQSLKATSVCSRITNTSMFHRRQQPPQ